MDKLNQVSHTACWWVCLCGRVLVVGVFLWASSIRKVTQWVCCVRYIRTCIHTYVHMYVRMSECTWNYVRMLFSLVILVLIVVVRCGTTSARRQTHVRRLWMKRSRGTYIRTYVYVELTYVPHTHTHTTYGLCHRVNHVVHKRWAYVYVPMCVCLHVCAYLCAYGVTLCVWHVYVRTYVCTYV